MLDHVPALRDPLFIAGFEGWGNALNLSKGMIDYLIEKLQAKPFGRLHPDPFYRFDENRPMVDIQDGMLKELTPPGGAFYATERSSEARDLVLLKAVEPNLGWYHFAESVLGLCSKLGVKTVICLGSMYDNVLHTDTVISALASSQGLLERLKEKRVISVNYKGPSAVHSTLLLQAQKMGMDCFSLWCHCPYYLQGTMHFGLMSHLASLLAPWCEFEPDTRELDATWKEIARQIQGVIEKNPDLQSMIGDLRKAKLKGSWEPGKAHEKVIHLEDFIRPK